MEPFIERKIEEMKEQKLVEWDQEAAKGRLAEVLFDCEGGKTRAYQDTRRQR